MRRGRPRKHGIEDNYTDKHIMYELRKCLVLNDHLLEFRNGEKSTVSIHKANELLDTYSNLSTPGLKQAFQEYIGASQENFDHIVSLPVITQKDIDKMCYWVKDSKVVDSYWAEIEKDF